VDPLRFSRIRRNPLQTMGRFAGLLKFFPVETRFAVAKEGKPSAMAARDRS